MVGVSFVWEKNPTKALLPLKIWMETADNHCVEIYIGSDAARMRIVFSD